jgi:hypothetical protein
MLESRDTEIELKKSIIKEIGNSLVLDEKDKGHE